MIPLDPSLRALVDVGPWQLEDGRRRAQVAYAAAAERHELADRPHLAAILDRAWWAEHEDPEPA